MRPSLRPAQSLSPRQATHAEGAASPVRHSGRSIAVRRQSASKLQVVVQVPTAAPVASSLVQKRSAGHPLRPIAGEHPATQRRVLASHTRPDVASPQSRSVAHPHAPATQAAPEPVDPYSDLAYQAMEHLAFTELSAEVASQDGGRLGVLFHIKGEHAPPTKQTIQLTWGEVLRRRIDRVVPLPSGTKVDLTLDTSVNLDQLLADLADYQRLHGSGSVQP